ncbi:MAG: hypothetical protein ACREJ2_08805 [Planctomycetota bacterium]
MFKQWQNAKLSTRLTFIFVMLMMFLIIGWFSGFLPNLILNYYRHEYDEMKKDPDSGYPSFKDRSDSWGMAAFMDVAYWYTIAQNSRKAREIYTEGLYRYGWDNPHGAEVWDTLMNMRMASDNADPIEGDAMLFYWLYAQRYNEIHGDNSGNFTYHPDFLKYEPDVERMIRAHGSKITGPNASNNFQLTTPSQQTHEQIAARMLLNEFFDLNRKYKINKVELKAMDDQSFDDYFSGSGAINSINLLDWQ